MRNLKPLISIVGPTGTGKTGLALQVLSQIPGEIISADSRQVYKQLDFTTNKLLLTQPSHNIQKFDNYWIVDGIRINGYDLVSVCERCDVDRFATELLKRMDEVWSEGGVPIIVGGTGFYADVLMGVSPYSTVPPDITFRKVAHSMSLPDLQAKLQSLDAVVWKSMSYAERQNKVRLTRYCELSVAAGSVAAALKYSSLKERIEQGEVNLKWVGLRAPYTHLYARTDAWVGSVMNSTECHKECEYLFQQRCPNANHLSEGLIYSQMREYLKGSLSLEQSLVEMQGQLHAYVRRQMTWFRRRHTIAWHDVTHPEWQVSLINKLTAWYDEITSNRW